MDYGLATELARQYWAAQVAVGAAGRDVPAARGSGVWQRFLEEMRDCLMLTPRGEQAASHSMFGHA